MQILLDETEVNAIVKEWAYNKYGSILNASDTDDIHVVSNHSGEYEDKAYCGAIVSKIIKEKQ